MCIRTERIKQMFELELTYHCDCSPEELDPHKKAILSGISYADVGCMFDAWYVTDTAIIETAVELGWDLNEAMKAEWIEEQLNNCLSFDGERTESIRGGLCNEAYEYITEWLERNAQTEAVSQKSENCL